MKTFRIHANIWIEVKADHEASAIERAQTFLSKKVNECEMDGYCGSLDGKHPCEHIEAHVYCGTLDEQTACEHIDDD